MNIVYLGYLDDRDAERGLGTEAARLRVAVQAAGAGGRITVHEKVNLDWDLAQSDIAKLRPEILHISCHGEEGEKLSILRDGSFTSVTGTTLAEALLALTFRPKLVVLSACFSAEIASLLANNGIAACGWTGRVAVRHAARFTSMFYQHLVELGTVGPALSQTQATALLTEEERDVHFRLCLPARGDTQVFTELTEAVAPTQRALTPSRPPHQLILHVDPYVSSMSYEVLRSHLDDRRELRKELHLSAFMEPLGLARMGRNAQDIDWDRLALATERMLLEADAWLPQDGVPVDVYVGGDAPHATFAHIGYRLTTWSGGGRLILLQSQRDAPPLVVELPAPPNVRCSYFDRPIEVVSDFANEETVGIYLDGVMAAPDARRIAGRAEAIPSAVLDHLGAPSPSFAVFGGVHTEPDPQRAGSVTPLDATRGWAAAAELNALASRISDRCPKSKVWVLYCRTSAIVALLAGRAANPRLCRQLRLTWYDVGTGGYTTAYELPLPERAPVLPDRPEDRLARRSIHDRVVEGMRRIIGSLDARMLRPPSAFSPELADRLARQLKDLRLPTEPEGEVFHLRLNARELRLGHGLLAAIQGESPETLANFGRLLLLHESIHGDQAITGTNYQGLGRAGVVLEEVDFWADAFAHLVNVRWQVTRNGPDAQEEVRARLTASIRDGVRGMIAFDRMEQGPRLSRLPERRLRRYLIWALQEARAAFVHTPEDMEALFAQRVFVELAPLHGSLDARGDKIVRAPNADTQLFVGIGGTVLRLPALPQNFAPASLVEATRAFDTDALVHAMAYVVDQHEARLTPWVLNRRSGGGGRARRD